MKPNWEHLEPEFIGSYPDWKKMPSADIPEFAFIGRSNVGKSSLINYLLGKKNLALTSSTPGKTRLLNLFSTNLGWNICDLPGYGYAKVSKSIRSQWGPMIEKYLKERQQCVCIFILIDTNVPPQQSDLDFIHNCGLWNVPFALVFTKIDKNNQRTVDTNVNGFLSILKESWEELPPYFYASAFRKKGKERILEYIQQIYQSVKG